MNWQQETNHYPKQWCELVRIYASLDPDLPYSTVCSNDAKDIRTIHLESKLLERNAKFKDILLPIAYQVT